jgi:cell division protein FtsI/penicillin-binding protein 2
MKFGKPVLFIGQIALLHALVAYHALAQDGKLAVEKTQTETKSVIVGTSGLGNANQNTIARAKTEKTDKAAAEKRKAAVRKKKLAKTLTPGALKLSSVYEEDGQMLADLEHGWSVETTLDPWLNGRAEYYLKRGKVPLGAIVIMDVKSGDVLALADRFVEGHEATQGFEVKGPASLALRKVAPAASIFKILSSAALIDNQFDPYRSIPYLYAKRKPTTKHLKAPGRDAATSDLGKALATSNNGFFARMTDKHLTRDDFMKAIDRFWFNKVIPFPVLTDASAANAPRNRLERARMSAGFGHSEITALHAAVIASAVATDGRLPTPRLVSRLHGPNGQVIDAPIRQPVSAAMKPGTAQIMCHMMAKTVKNGTARRSFRKWPKRLQHIRVGGKTGTLTRYKPARTTFTWFVGYAPVDNPQIAIAVMVGNGDKWWQRAKDIARDVLAAHFTRQAKRTVASKSKRKRGQSAR